MELRWGDKRIYIWPHYPSSLLNCLRHPPLSVRERRVYGGAVHSSVLKGRCISKSKASGNCYCCCRNFGIRGVPHSHPSQGDTKTIKSCIARFRRSVHLYKCVVECVRIVGTAVPALRKRSTVADAWLAAKSDNAPIFRCECDWRQMRYGGCMSWLLSCVHVVLACGQGKQANAARTSG